MLSLPKKSTPRIFYTTLHTRGRKSKRRYKSAGSARHGHLFISAAIIHGRLWYSPIVLVCLHVYVRLTTQIVNFGIFSANVRLILCGHERGLDALNFDIIFASSTTPTRLGLRAIWENIEKFLSRLHCRSFLCVCGSSQS